MDGETKVTIRRGQFDEPQADALKALSETLCDPKLAPAGPLKQLCASAIIRDEHITSLSLDLKETDRYALLRDALGASDADAWIARGAQLDYEERLQSIVEATDIPRDRKERLLGMKKEELLREIVDNVGKRGTAGQDLQTVISVAMLSEGWDAKNVTHIMGLRAFTSQLLCEQVIGRGLRRVSYETDENGLFLPEYVNVFGVPLSIFQDVGGNGETPPPPKPSTQVESLPERNELEIRWPNVLRIDPIVRPVLTVDWEKVEPLTLDPAQTPISAEIAPALGGATDWNKIHVIDLEKLPEEFRLQRLTFKAARKAHEELRGERFKGNRDYLVLQLIRLVDQFLGSKKIVIPTLFHQEPLRKRILFALNIDIIVQHLLRFVVEQNQERIEPVFDEHDFELVRREAHRALAEELVCGCAPSTIRGVLGEVTL